MDQLREKIEKTSLFSEEEKQVILSLLPTMSETEQEDLEESINDYNDSINALVKKNRLEISEDLIKLKNSANPDEQKLAQETEEFFTSITSSDNK